MKNLPFVLIFLLCCATHAAEVPAMKIGQILKPLYISAHRAGGRVYAPDNSLPNMEHAMTLGVTSIEIDLRPTSDGHLVLSHDSRLPRELFGQDKLFLNRMTLAEIARLRYSAAVADHAWQDLAIPNADEIIEKYKDRINFQLDVKNAPVKLVMDMIRRHGIKDRVVVSCKDLDYLRQVKAAAPGIVVEWAQNTLGRYQDGKKWTPYPMPRQLELYHEAMKKLKAIGGEMLCTKLLTPEKVVICHSYGVCVRPSVQSVGMTDGARFIRMGCDGFLADDPAKVLGGVKKFLGEAYLPASSVPVARVIHQRKGQ